MFFRVFRDTIRANRRNFELLLCILMLILHNNNFFCIDVFKVSSAIYHKSCKIRQLYLRFLHKIACFRNRRNLHLRTFPQPCETSVFLLAQTRDLRITSPKPLRTVFSPLVFPKRICFAHYALARARVAYRVSRIILFIIILYNILIII